MLMTVLTTQVQGRKKIVLGDIIAHIDSIYINDSVSMRLIHAYQFTKNDVLAYLDSIKRPNLTEKAPISYYKAFAESLQSNDLAGIEKNALIYTMLGDTADINVIYEHLIRVYGSMGKRDEANFIFNEWSILSELNDDKWKASINKMKTEFAEFLSPSTLKEEPFDGMLVSLATNKYCLPEFMIKFYGGSSARLWKSENRLYITKKKKGYYTSSPIDHQMSIPQYFCYDANGHAHMFFNSQKVRNGNRLLASSLFDLSSDISSIAQDAANKAYNTDLWNAMKVSAAGNLTSSLLLAAAMYAAKSERVVESLEFELEYKNNKIWDANYTQFAAKVNSSEGKTILKDTVKQQTVFYKWEPEDDIVFFDDKTYKPITLNPISNKSALFKDVKYINRMNTCRKISNGILYYGATWTSIGLFGLTYSLKKIDYEEKSIDDNEVWEEATSVFLTLAIYGGVHAAIGGILSHIFAKKAKKRITSINEKSMQKLDSKTWNSVSISPLIDPINRGGGINLSINY